MAKITSYQRISSFFQSIKWIIKRKQMDPFDRIFEDLKRETEKYLRNTIIKNRGSDD
jgi:hypothetical protein